VSFPDFGSESYRLNERAKRSLPGGNARTTVYAKPYPLYAARGAGCRVWDVDGVERIDCINNFTAAIHGYAHPEILRAAHARLDLGTAFGLPTLSEIELAELLSARVSTVEQCRFLNSGTEAVMAALKAARAYTGKPKIAKCEGAYHGSYDYAEVSLDSPIDNRDKTPPKSIPYAAGTPVGVLNDVVVIPFNDVDRSVEVLRAHGHELAAILVDPMPNRAGLVPADRSYLQALREIATEIGALLIFDEVIVFRLGFNGAQALWNIEADLTVFGKIIGGGFPVGAVGGSTEVMAVFDPTQGKPALPQSGTFSANPMSMTCGRVAMELLDPPAYEHLDNIGQRVRHGIDEALRRTGTDGQTTGKGSLIKMHFTNAPVRDYRSAAPSADSLRKLAAFNTAALNEGLLIANYGLFALSTPMTNADAEFIIQAVEKSLTRMARQ
jgi:glutamate-1-semialdehyde 2,1-aminomutase